MVEMGVYGPRSVLEEVKRRVAGLLGSADLPNGSPELVIHAAEAQDFQADTRRLRIACVAAERQPGGDFRELAIWQACLLSV
jgi:hypothetical protein